jgi:hypothetical protein
LTYFCNFSADAIDLPFFVGLRLFVPLLYFLMRPFVAIAGLIRLLATVVIHQVRTKAKRMLL